MKFNLGSGTKSIIKKVALVLAGITAVTAVGFGAKAIYERAKDDLKTITPTFEVGNLGADGKFVDDKSTLYTKEAFGCYGLQVKPDFDSTVDYQFFYYDILDNFVSSSAVLSNGFSEEAPMNGAYARMVIIPRNDEDGKISLLERVQYPSQLTIKVKKEQDIENRFSVFKGKVLSVVNHLSDLSFTPKLFIDPSSRDWVTSDRQAVTATTVLRVEPGSTLSFDGSTLGSSVLCRIYVYEFSALPLNDNIVEGCFGSECDSVATLSNKTNYILLAVNCYNGTITWDSSVVSKLPSTFKITK